MKSLSLFAVRLCQVMLMVSFCLSLSSWGICENEDHQIEKELIGRISTLQTMISELEMLPTQNSIEKRLYKMAQREYEDLTDQVVAGVIMCDMKGVVQKANMAMGDLLSSRRKELSGYTWKEMITEKRHKQMRYMMVRARTKEIVQFDSEFVRRDGRIVPVTVFLWLNKTEKKRLISMGMFVYQRGVI